MPSKTRKKPSTRRLDRKVLVLSKSYMPINVVTVRRAIELWYSDRADVVDVYQDIELHSGVNTATGKTITIKAPSIIHMHQSRLSKDIMIKAIPFSRTHVFARDNGQCVYCHKELNLGNFTIDHVIPQSKGGLTDWYNCRVCCTRCNSDKADKTLEELGWPEPRKVDVPTLTKKVSKSIITKIGGKIPDESWRPYIYWEWKGIGESYGR